MRNNAHFPKIRINSDLLKEIEETISKLNENQEGIEISQAEFRRMAYRHFVRSIKEEGLSLSWKPKE